MRRVAIRRFTRLYDELDATTKTGEKVASLEAYFREARAEDAAWALRFLVGRRLKRVVSSRALRDAIQEATGYPMWLIGECYDAIGDMSETVTLLLPDRSEGTEESLSEVVEHRLRPLQAADEARQKTILIDAWSHFNERQRFVFHKLISGAFRVGVQRRLVARALAAVADVDAAVMTHRLTGTIEPTAKAFVGLLQPDGLQDHASRPYPFFLAQQLNVPPETLGEAGDWQIEWKWDGIRAQVIHRDGHAIVWSRGEDVITAQFPEVGAVARALPDGTVLDGEILAWRGERPSSFADLQTRLGRKVAPTAQLSLFERETVIFMAYDLLERRREDRRDQPLRERRVELESLVESISERAPIRISPIIRADSWDEVARRRVGAREEQGAEGLMLKHRDSTYGVGRAQAPSGAAGATSWWKWKVDPFTVDAVLIYAQPGHGRRAGLFTDYTFAVWEDEEDEAGASERRLTPFCKAYSGLTNDEIEQVDAFVRRNTLEKMGPVRAVKPELVFEIAFAGIQESSRHKSGIAVRFPRIARWRSDKRVDEADTIHILRELLRMVQG